MCVCVLPPGQNKNWYKEKFGTNGWFWDTEEGSAKGKGKGKGAGKGKDSGP